MPKTTFRGVFFGMNIALLIPAGGSGSRYLASGALRSKLDEDLGGRPVLQRTIENFVNNNEVGHLFKAIVVAGPANPEEFAEFKARHGDRLGLLGATLTRGGEQFRSESVKAALLLLATLPAAKEITHIAVHDAARPCASPELIQRVVEAAVRNPAVIPAVDVSDTIKRVAIDTDAAPSEDDDPVARILGARSRAPAARIVIETISRENLVLVQTPQIFEYELFKAAYAQEDLATTDDAGLVERIGKKVTIVAGDERNIKITRTGDLVLARSILHVAAPSGRAAHKKF